MCVSTRRRIAHVISSRIFPKFSTKFNVFVFLLVMAAAITIPLTGAMHETSVTNFFKDVFGVAVMMSVFYNTCLATTRLFMTLPPLRLNGRRICEGRSPSSSIRIAKREKILVLKEVQLFEESEVKSAHLFLRACEER